MSVAKTLKLDNDYLLSVINYWKHSRIVSTVFMDKNRLAAGRRCRRSGERAHIKDQAIATWNHDDLNVWVELLNGQILDQLRRERLQSFDWPRPGPGPQQRPDQLEPF